MNNILLFGEAIFRGMGIGGWNTMIDLAIEQADQHHRWEKEQIRLARRDQIKTFNKRKAQKRAYCK